MYELMRLLISKNNELESMKAYITDETSLNIIKAKQDTIDDIYKVAQSINTTQVLSVGNEYY